MHMTFVVIRLCIVVAFVEAIVCSSDFKVQEKLPLKGSHPTFTIPLTKEQVVQILESDAVTQVCKAAVDLLHVEAEDRKVLSVLRVRARKCSFFRTCTGLRDRSTCTLLSCSCYRVCSSFSFGLRLVKRPQLYGVPVLHVRNDSELRHGMFLFATNACRAKSCICCCTVKDALDDELEPLHFHCVMHLGCTNWRRNLPQSQGAPSCFLHNSKLY